MIAALTRNDDRKPIAAIARPPTSGPTKLPVCIAVLTVLRAKPVRARGAIVATRVAAAAPVPVSAP